MLATLDGADSAPSSPREIFLDLLRATDTESPFAFVLQEQFYVRHLEGGAGRSACFPWSEQVLEHLAAIQRDRANPAAAAWLGEEMRSFLDRLGWGLDEEGIRKALDAGRPVHLTLRLGAAELYALPWELVPLGATGRPLGSLPGFLLRYEWPDTRTARPKPDPPPEGGRILFAWSAAGGVVPADEHLGAIRRACQEGRHPGFDRTRDVVPHASLGRLRQALQAGPVAVLHILCHGAQLDAAGAAYGLVMDADDRSGREIIDARALQVALADHLSSLRLVVLCACHGGDPGALDSRLGSVAQALHRAGVPAVVASRYPLAVDASVALTEVLYRDLLVQERSLLEAFLGARDRLRERASRSGWAALQMYARAADGPELRPIVRRPYRGLLAFQEEHARYFYGREAEVEEALQDLSALVAAKDAAKPRFLICTGASGTGKSSLVLAGVVPALRARDGRWAVATLRPHEGWRASLQAALASRSDPDAPLLLVVDQFEELFTMISEKAEREAFVRELWSLASPPGSGVSVIATLRVDFLARCGDIQLWSGDRFLEDMAYDEAHRVFIRRMKPEHLRRIIEQPAEQVGLALEEGLVEQMLKDAGDEPGALPLLEYTLDQMWQQRRGRLLTWEQYNDLGGVGGALEKKADAILADFDEVRRQAARRLLVQLVTLDGDARLDRRRRMPLDKLRRGSPSEAAVFGEVLDTLSRERLLVMSGEDEGQGPRGQHGEEAAQGAGEAEGRSPVVEVAHEQLIRSWGTLRAWVREDRQMLAELQQIDRWVEEAKGFPDYVLDGDRLGHARALLARYAVDIGEAARELILRSERAAQRKRRWAFGAAVAASVAAVVMGVLALVAMDQRDSAQQARGVAEKQTALAQGAQHEAEQQAERAQNASLVAGARELLARNQPEAATSLLLAVKEPERVHGWIHAALDVFAGGIPEVTFRGHGDVVSTAFFSPDGQRVVTASADNTARIWRADGSGPPIFLRGHTGRVHFAAFSPDGQRVVTASDDHTARVWRADGSGTFVELKKHEAPVVHAAFSPDGQRVVTASDDRTACVFKIDGSLVTCLEGHGVPVSTAAFSPDGKRIVTSASYRRSRPVLGYSPDKTARVWSADGSGQLFALVHEYNTTSATFSPDGKHIITVSAGSTAYLWNEDGSGSPIVLEGHEGAITSAAFSPDSKYVVTASRDTTARLWYAAGAQVPDGILRGHTGAVLSAAFSHDGKRIITTSSDGTARVWDADKQMNYLVLRGHQRDVSSAAFSPDGQRVVTASVDRTARVWRTGGSAIPLVLDTGSSSAPGVFSPDGERILVMSSGSEAVKIWSTDGTSGPVTLTDVNHVTSVAFSPDGKRIATVSSLKRPKIPTPFDPAAPRPVENFEEVNGTARVWGIDGAGPLLFLHHESQVNSVAYSPDGQRIVTAATDRTARVWRADGSTFADGSRFVALSHHANVTTAAFSPDGKRILTVTSAAKDREPAAHVWRVEGSGDPIVFPHDAEITAAAFSPDGQRILTVSKDDKVRVWSADRAGDPVLIDNKAKVTAAVFSPDGQHVVTAFQSFVRSWRADRPGPPTAIGSHPDPVNSIAFSPDGKHIVTAAADGVARVWRADGSGDPIVLAGPHYATVFASFSPDGKRIAVIYPSTLRIWDTSINVLQQRLRDSTRDCLSYEMRQTYLGETVGDARARSGDCEREHTRLP